MEGRTPILHFTHESNLDRIFDQAGLLCDRLCGSSGIKVRDVAYSNIKRQRAETPVEVSPGGMLDQYVPFYFGARSPMMLTYMNGNVTGKREDLSELVYLVSYAETVAERGLPFAFTDGHPIVEPRSFFNDLADLREVDLELMSQQWWYDTDAYPDRKRRRQAEFLISERAPLDLFAGFVVMTDTKRVDLEQALRGRGIPMPVRVRRSWYY
jgi:hypothetical protein